MVPSCHITRRKHEGRDTASLLNPRWEKSRCRGFEPWTFGTVWLLLSSICNQSIEIIKNNIRSAVTPCGYLADMPTEGSTRARTLPGCPSLDGRSRDAEVGFEPQTFGGVYPLSRNTLLVPSSHATRRKYEGWDTATLPKPRQGKSRGGGRIRTRTLRSRVPAEWSSSTIIQVFRKECKSVKTTVISHWYPPHPRCSAALFCEIWWTTERFVKTKLGFALVDDASTISSPRDRFLNSITPL
ncbi:hypothetical protein T265_07685 [Opisthorchis viverrini]|uniref:Uncharacterized protein n=1 Tax=Opisthorchis viverrini TaxID=6198 RepID=A0A074ZN28_OPIVI|nr:hypothetical protein T265_07685 [Opisthorchis viverrini]KER24735.1 hypothetical protein T265_07685 [Opisthorchis viverrini]